MRRHDKKGAPPEPNGKAGVQRVAEAAGVSIATVSRVFSGSKPVSEDIRTRVMNAAAKAGFAPNALARALKTGRLDTVGIVLAGSNLMGEFYSETLAGFHSVCGRNDLRVMVTIIHEEGDIQQKTIDTIQDGWCAGMVIQFNLIPDLKALQSVTIPVTLLNYSPPKRSRASKASSVGFDNGMGIQEAVRYLSAIGHRKIGYFGGSELSQDAADREQAFRATTKQLQLTIHEPWIIACSFEAGPETGRAAMEKLLRHPGETPTAVICASDNIAMGAISGADRWGRSVPQDISIIGYDDCTWAQNYRPALTTVQHKGWDLGRAAAETLIAHMQHPVRPPPPVILPTHLVVRDSTAAPARAAGPRK